MRRISWFFRNAGFVVAMEVPIGLRAMDLFAAHPTNGTTIAVEAKLKAWRRALQQAQLYRLVADFVYVALPEQTVNRHCLDACRAAGIGLLAVPMKGKAQIVLPACQQEDHYKSFVRRAVQTIGPRAGYASLMI